MAIDFYLDQRCGKREGGRHPRSRHVAMPGWANRLFLVYVLMHSFNIRVLKNPMVVSIGIKSGAVQNKVLHVSSTHGVTTRACAVVLMPFFASASLLDCIRGSCRGSKYILIDISSAQPRGESLKIREGVIRFSPSR